MDQTFTSGHSKEKATTRLKIRKQSQEDMKSDPKFKTLSSILTPKIKFQNLFSRFPASAITLTVPEVQVVYHLFNRRRFKLKPRKRLYLPKKYSKTLVNEIFI